MRHVKLLLISGIFFFVLFTLIGLLFPSQIRVVSSIVVHKEPDAIKRSLLATGQWKQWHPVLDSNGVVKEINAGTAEITAAGRTFTLDHKTTDSNSVSFSISGSGTVTDTRIMLLPVSAGAAQTQVVWHETQQLKWYPWDRFRGLVLEKAKREYLDTVVNRFKNYMDTLTTP